MNNIYGFLGRQGCGKTMLMTAIGVRNHLEYGKKLFANYHLKNVDYTPITSMADIENMRDGVALLDEFWLWLFSRMSQSKVNKALNKVVMLNRKRNVDIYYTAQLSRSIDVMVREVTTKFFYPRIIRYDGDKGSKKYYIKFEIYDALGHKLKSVQLKQDTVYWGGFFDTSEEIGNMEKKETMLKKGMVLEKYFVSALEKKRKFKQVKHLDLSGHGSGILADVLIYSNTITYMADVKGSCKDYVYIEPSKIRKQLKNAYDNNFKFIFVFPDNKIDTDDKKQLRNCENWFIYEPSYDSYVCSLKKNPSYNKLIRYCCSLSDYKFK